MTQIQKLQIFSERNVRAVWDSEKEEWYFSVVDVCGILTESADPSKYWRVLKTRLKKEGVETATICSRLKLTAYDGKQRLTDVATTEQMFRLVQSIPSPKAEPFKQWMAQVAAQRIDQLQNPELSINQAVADYQRLGYSEQWINQRIRTIEVRKLLTDEWQRRGVKEQQYAALTDIITRQWSGMTTREYKEHKGLKKQNLRDNMTNIELALNMLAEASTTELSQSKTPTSFSGSAAVAKEGGQVAKSARDELERRLGRTVISSQKASDYLIPKKAGGNLLLSNTDNNGE